MSCSMLEIYMSWREKSVLKVQNWLKIKANLYFINERKYQFTNQFCRIELDFLINIVLLSKHRVKIEDFDIS